MAPIPVPSPVPLPVSLPHPVSVRGGAGGITAHCDQIVTVGRRFGAAATDTAHSAWALHGYLAHPALAASATLDPIGFATFETELLGALDGVQGLTWAGVECAAVDAELRVAAVAYEAADRLSVALHDEVLGALGVPRAAAVAGAVLARTHDVAAATQAAAATDPAGVDTVVDLLGIPAQITAAATVVPDGHGVAYPLGVDTTGAAGRPPRVLSDILAGLDQRNADPHHGAVDVRILTMADGTRRVIVDITGTKTWTLHPTDDITSVTTNGRSLIGEPTAYEQGVLQAMRDAGVRPGDDVMLVGHSEGGMVAVTTARDAVRTGAFHVTHVITAGSPIGRTVGQLPPSVQVLALENSQDVVPHLDGRANTDEPNVTTVSGRRGDGTVGGDHGVGTAYVPLAGDAQASADPSIRAYLAGADGYLHATAVQTHTFQITRRY